MTSIAKGLIFRMPASAQADDRAAGKTKNCAFGIADFKIALDTQRAVVADSNFRCCQEILPPFRNFNANLFGCPAP